MIRHVVLWNFVGNPDAATRQEYLAQIQEALESQVGTIPGLVSMSAALNVGESEHCLDLVLDSEFENLDALLAYHHNPNHHVVRDVVDPLVTDVCGIDYVVE